MLRQALLGLDYLHQNEIVHGDFQPGNLLFSVSGLDAVDEACLLQATGPEAFSEPVRRRDGKFDLWAPRYLALNQPLKEFADIGPDFKVKVSDLGGGELPLPHPTFSQLPSSANTREQSFLFDQPTRAYCYSSRSSRSRTDFRR